MSFEEVKNRVLSLDVKERAALARALLETLAEPSKEEIAALWVQEAERRLEGVERGNIRVISSEEAWHRRVIAERRGGETISLDEMRKRLGL